MLDLALMHHFTTNTAPLLIPWNEEVVKWWVHEVPRVVFAHPFAMQTLLALTGLHVAYMSTSSSPATVPFSSDRNFHIRRAISQNQAAMETATSILATRNVTPETSEPLYVFSIMTLMVSLAMPRDEASVFVSESAGVTEWVKLLKGAITIVDLGRHWIKEGGLKSALEEDTLPGALWKEQGETALGQQRDWEGGNGNSNKLPASDTPGGPPLSELRSFLVSHRITVDEDLGITGDEQSWQVCVGALDLLQRVFAAFLEHGRTLQTMRLVFSWLDRVNPKFWELLGQHQLPALLVFSYFGVLLHWLHGLWWLEGWGPHILTTTAHFLDEKYHKWLEWPRTQVGITEERGSSR